ncbi:MAG TPA: hypothetical protein VKP89_02355 [Burkholderiales bacterium]|nr:hypothetical protein [Burkholderiales bacterium]
MIAQPRKAHVLTHLLPGNVIAEARQLALSLRRDEQVRRYALTRIWLIIPAALIFFLIATACAMGTARFLDQLFEQPMNGWLVASVLVLGLFVWFAALMSQLYALFSWLEARALRESQAGLPPTAQGVGKLDARSGSTRAKSSAWLIAVFVVVPLFALAAVSPAVAIALVAVGIFAPILYTLIDQ